MGRPAEAERYFADLVVKEPRSAVVRVARGFSRIASNPAGAQSDLSQALAEEPRHAHAHYGMAVLRAARNLREALEHLERALEIRSQLDRRRCNCVPWSGHDWGTRPHSTTSSDFSKARLLSPLQRRLRACRLLGEGA